MASLRKILADEQVIVRSANLESSPFAKSLEKVLTPLFTSRSKLIVRAADRKIFVIVRIPDEVTVDDPQAIEAVLEKLSHFFGLPVEVADTTEDRIYFVVNFSAG